MVLSLGQYGVSRWLYQLALLIFLGLSTQSAIAVTPPKLIVAFGDSLSAGYQLAANESFPAQLQVALTRAGHVVDVRNAGVSGDTSSAGRARLSWVLAGLKAKPDLVILELGANDMLRGQNPALTGANLDAMLAEFAKRGIPVILAGMRASPNLGKTYAQAFDSQYPALAAKYKVRLYPFFLSGVAATPKLQLRDGMHPNAAGVAVIVRQILPMVESALK